MLVRNAWLFVVPVVAGPVTARAQAELTRVSFWEAHGWKIAVVVAVLVLQTVLIALLLANRRHLRLARMDLHESAEHMRLAARAAKTASWMLDLKTNRVWTTPEGRALLGWGETEPIDLDRFIATLPPEERERARRGVANALTDGGEFAADYRVVLADGSERWISMRGRAEFDGNHRPMCVRGVSMDVTAQRQAVAEAGVALAVSEGEVDRRLRGLRRDTTTIST